MKSQASRNARNKCNKARKATSKKDLQRMGADVINATEAAASRNLKDAEKELQDLHYPRCASPPTTYITGRAGEVAEDDAYLFSQQIAEMFYKLLSIEVDQWKPDTIFETKYRYLIRGIEVKMKELINAYLDSWHPWPGKGNFQTEMEAMQTKFEGVAAEGCFTGHAPGIMTDTYSILMNMLNTTRIGFLASYV